MSNAKQDGKLKIGSALATLAAKECRSLQHALSVDKGWHSGIHDARRSCRRLRSLLAFLEPSSNQQAIALDKALRQLAHGFSVLRDAHVATRTARLLATTHQTVLTPAIVSALEDHSAALLEKALESDPKWHRRCTKAERIATELKELNWQDASALTAKEVLRRSVRRMKKTRRNALEQRTDMAFHRWRRRARLLRYQLEFLRKARQLAGLKKSGTRRYDLRIKRLGLIIDRLGWRQDFQVFLSTLDQLPASVDVAAVRKALTAKSKIRPKALSAKSASAHAKPNTDSMPG